MLMVPQSRESSDPLLQKWTTSAVLAVCRERPGMMAPLRREFGPVINRIKAGADTDQPPLDLHRFCVHVVSQLWAQENRRRGMGSVRGSDWRVLLYAMAGAQTIREAILRCIDCYEVMDQRCGGIALRVCDGQAEVRFDSLNAPLNLGSALVSLFGVAEFHGLLQKLITQPLRLTRIHLNHGEDIFVSVGVPPLPFPLVLNAGWSGFTFATPILDYPIEAQAFAVFARSGGSFLFGGEDAVWRRNLAEWVRRIAIGELKMNQSLPTFDKIAASVGLSAATLRRRLSSQGTSYREVKESCRRELGLKLLRHSDLSIEDIAARLDYCDSDAFRRAFMGWMGTSPKRFRNMPAV